MKQILLLTLCFVFAFQAKAQNEEKAKAYYFSAVEQYESRNYSKAIEYCQMAEDLLGGTNARVEAVRLKSYYDNEDIKKAQESLNVFLTLGADESLLQEISPYIVKIEGAEKERIRLIKAVKEEYIRKEREKEDLISNAVFSEGIGLAKNKEGKYGYIDREGNTVIKYQYDYAEPFKNGVAQVHYPSSGIPVFAYINKEKKNIIYCRPCKYLSPYEGEIIYLVTDNEKDNRGKFPYRIEFRDRKDGSIFSLVVNAKYVEKLKNNKTEAEKGFITYLLSDVIVAPPQGEALKLLYKNNPTIKKDKAYALKLMETGDSYIRSHGHFFRIKLKSLSRDESKAKAFDFYREALEILPNNQDIKDRISFLQDIINDQIYTDNRGSEAEELSLDILFMELKFNLQTNTQMEKKLIDYKGYIHRYYKYEREFANYCEERFNFLEGYLAEKKGDLKTAKRKYKASRKNKRSMERRIANEFLSRK